MYEATAIVICMIHSLETDKLIAIVRRHRIVHATTYGQVRIVEHVDVGTCAALGYGEYLSSRMALYTKFVHR